MKGLLIDFALIALIALLVVFCLVYGEAFPAPVRLKMGKRTIVCLCGSTRFADAYARAYREEGLAGKIVLSVVLKGHQEGLDMQGPVKAGLDTLHLDKIELADEVLILNVLARVCPRCKTVWRHDHIRIEGCSCGEDISKVEPAGYIGESTRRELAHARQLRKVIRWLNP